MRKSCFLFGHADTPQSVLPILEQAIEKEVANDISTFYVGYHGNFDRMAACALRSVKHRHAEISLMLVLAYHPAEQAIEAPKGFDGTYYPPLEGIPRRYAIVRANQYMVKTADSLICCNVSNWTDIVSIAAGGYHSVGLKANGTVVAVGGMGYGECDVRNWNNIVSVAACERITIGLKENGTLVFTGEIDDYELNRLGKLTNVAAIYANSSTIFVLTKDGTITWTNGSQVWEGENKFISFANDGYDNYAGLRSDGTILIGGRYPTDVTGFDQIAQLACGHNFTVGVRIDGTVVFAGANQNVSNCESWKDVVLIDAEGINGGHIVALHSDGTVTAIGDNKYEECNVNDWTNIVVPRQLLHEQ